jgi:hypothetical protein
MDGLVGSRVPKLIIARLKAAANTSALASKKNQRTGIQRILVIGTSFERL